MLISRELLSLLYEEGKNDSLISSLQGINYLSIMTQSGVPNILYSSSCVLTLPVLFDLNSNCIIGFKND